MGGLHGLHPPLHYLPPPHGLSQLPPPLQFPHHHHPHHHHPQQGRLVLPWPSAWLQWRPWCAWTALHVPAGAAASAQPAKATRLCTGSSRAGARLVSATACPAGLMRACLHADRLGSTWHSGPGRTGPMRLPRLLSPTTAAPGGGSRLLGGHLQFARWVTAYGGIHVQATNTAGSKTCSPLTALWNTKYRDGQGHL